MRAGRGEREKEREGEKVKKRSQIPNQGVILNLFQDLIRVVALVRRFRNKFGMTQRGFEIVS